MPLIDFNSIPDADEGINHLPAGQYLAKVAKVEPDTSKQNNLVWKFAFEVVEGPFKGQPLYDNITWTEGGMKRVKLVLKRLGVDMNRPVDTDRLVMEGRHAVVTLAPDSYVKESTGQKVESMKVPFAGVEEPDLGVLARLGLNPAWKDYVAAEHARLNQLSGIGAPAVAQPAPAAAAQVYQQQAEPVAAAVQQTFPAAQTVAEPPAVQAGPPAPSGPPGIVHVGPAAPPPVGPPPAAAAPGKQGVPF